MYSPYQNALVMEATDSQTKADTNHRPGPAKPKGSGDQSKESGSRNNSHRVVQRVLREFHYEIVILLIIN